MEPPLRGEGSAVVGGPDDQSAIVREAVELFCARMLADPLLRARFTGMDMDRLRAHQRDFLIAALVGGDLYRGRGMAVAHDGLGITDAEFDRSVEHLMAAMAEAGLGAARLGLLRARVEPLRADIVGR